MDEKKNFIDRKEPLPSAKKLKEYLDTNGIRHAWFAKKIGIANGTLSKYLLGQGKLPKKAWREVILLTKGKISMKDLLNDFFADVEDSHD